MGETCELLFQVQPRRNLDVLLMLRAMGFNTFSRPVSPRYRSNF